MKILPKWLREFVEIPVDDRQLADDLTNAGTAVEGIDIVEGEAVFEVEFTANRVDTMNHYGVARECSAIYDRDLKALQDGTPSQASGAGGGQFSIEIEAPELCARYTARIVRNAKVAASPETAVKRLALMESRSINNLTDASNYTLLEMGHPTHCFDLDKLEGGKIVIRSARPGEKLRTLDGVERILHPEDLVIADAVKPVALAGVIGGFDTMITAETRNVLVESAWFAPSAIRKTARRHGLHTDASHRFERGADIGATSLACSLVVGRIAGWAGGIPAENEIDVFPGPPDKTAVRLRRPQLRRVLGQEIPEQDIERILGRLGFRVVPGRVAPNAVVSAARPAGSGGVRVAVAEQVADFTVEPPTWRRDVEREIDLIEEIARVYGYDRFPVSLPPFAGAMEELPDAAKDSKLRSTLLALGYHEAISLAFISREDATLFSDSGAVELANAVSDEAPVLRTSMLAGMLGMLSWNLHRGSSEARLFESGHTFQRPGEIPVEGRSLCMGSTGAALERLLPDPRFGDLSVIDQGSAESSVDIAVFRVFKGEVEALLEHFDHSALHFEDLASDLFHPGRAAQAMMDGVRVVRFGQLHPGIAAGRKLRQQIYLAEFDLERLFRHSLRQPKYRPVPAYPAVERDFSFFFPDQVRWERIASAVRALAIAELQVVRPAEIFRGGSVGADEYSLLLRVTFRSPDRTLRDDEVALWASQIRQALEGLGGRART